MCTAPGIAPPRARADGRAAVLAVAARVEDDGVAAGRSRRARRCQVAIAARRASRSTRVAAGGAASRVTGNPPRVHAPNPPSSSRTDGMAEVLEKPERARRAHAGLLVVDDDRRRRVDAARGEQVLDHPHERLERRRVGVDQADAEQIEVDARPGMCPAA